MPAPYAIFCANPLDPPSAEPDFSLEFAVAREAGFSPTLIDHDELDQRISPRAAVRKTRIDEPGVGVYRGWMLRSEAYAGLFNALLDRGVRLLTSPEEEAACHHAPGSYALLKDWMASMTWVPLPAIDDQVEVRASLAQFRSSAVTKDFVTRPQVTGVRRTRTASLAAFESFKETVSSGGWFSRPTFPCSRPAHPPMSTAPFLWMDGSWDVGRVRTWRGNWALPQPS